MACPQIKLVREQNEENYESLQAELESVRQQRDIALAEVCLLNLNDMSAAC